MLIPVIKDCTGHQLLRDCGNGWRLVAEQGIIAILRRNDGILHTDLVRIYLKMIHGIKIFTIIYRLTAWFTYFTSKRKASLGFPVGILHIIGTVDFSQKSLGNGDFLPLLMTPILIFLQAFEELQHVASQISIENKKYYGIQ